MGSLGRDVKGMETVALMAEYKQLKYCQVSMFPKGCDRRNELGKELIRRGITAQPNIFGDIAIRTDWQPL